MKDLQREILSQVASGTISAAEGAARLEALREPEPVPVLPASPAVTATSPRQVKVISVLGSAQVLADPTVAVAVAEGPHRVRTEGDTLVIEQASLDDASDSFTFGGGRRVFVSGPDFHRRSISIRMNPELALAASVQAGNINVVGLRGPITGDVQAGNFRIDDFSGPLKVNVQAGNVTASGRIDAGDSSIHCEMGSVKVTLSKGSSVRITAKATMGKVQVEGGGTARPASGDDGKAVTVGSGSGTLDIDCTMGSVRVNAE